MKKLIIFLLSSVFCFVICSCAGNTGNTVETEESSTLIETEEQAIEIAKKEACYDLCDICSVPSIGITYDDVSCEKKGNYYEVQVEGEYYRDYYKSKPKAGESGVPYRYKLKIYENGEAEIIG